MLNLADFVRNSCFFGIALILRWGDDDQTLRAKSVLEFGELLAAWPWLNARIRQDRFFMVSELEDSSNA